MTKYIVLSILCIAASVTSYAASAAEINLSNPFYITSIEYRTSYSGGAYPDCGDCLYIQGALSPSCGTGFIVLSRNITVAEYSMLKAMAMLAYSTRQKVQVGYADCQQWNGAWAGNANRIYIVGP